MKYRFIFLFILILFSNKVSSQSYSIKGNITDTDTHDAIPFVSITTSIKQNGTLADMDGNFEVKIQSTSILYFQVAGYLSYAIPISPDATLGNLSITLKKKVIESPTEWSSNETNKARQIINKVIQNINTNNPEKLQSFTYTSSNKMTFTIGGDSLSDTKPSTITNDSLPKDSMEIKLNKFIAKQPLFQSEFVSERHFKNPDKNIENVVSSKISGINDPIFILLATQIESISFYNDYINLFDRHYLNPINSTNASNYLFHVEDTIFYNMPDTTFVVSFQPKKDKSFESLSGLFCINTGGYALQYVLASPSAIDNRFSIKIRQKYDYIDHKQWFPVEWSTSIIFHNTKIKTTAHNHPIIGTGRYKLSHIIINPEVSDQEFSHIPAGITSGENSTNHPQGSSTKKILSKQDSITYHILDSIQNKIKLDQKMFFLEAMVYEYFSIAGFNIDYRRLIGLNKFEGLKLGLGLATNPQIFSFASVGGFFTYGLGDKNWKYGGFVQLFPKWYSNTKLTIKYAKNVNETGAFNFLDDYVLNSTDFIRNYFIKKMDKTRDAELAFSSYLFQYLKYNVYAKRSEKKFENYQFVSPTPLSTPIDHMTFSEIGIQLKYAYGEKYMKTPRGQLVSLGTKYPIIWVNLRKGTGLFKGEVSYFKYEAKISKNFTTKTIGTTSVQIKTGKVFGDIPLSNLYGSQGCFETFTINVDNNFATIRPGEFYSKEFLFLFVKQNLGSLLYQKNKFAPELNLITNIGWGQLPDAWMHQNITFQTMEKGYIESGILINRMLNMDYISLGFGCFYRYGYYQFDKTANNVAYKLSFTYNL